MRAVTTRVRSVVVAAMLALALRANPAAAASPTPAPLGAEEAAAIGIEAYFYAYPLVLSELTRRVQTNVGDGAPARPGTMPGAPMNQFAHQRTLADDTTLEPLRPNADVLTSTLWFDVGAEPLVIAIPAAAGRYYTLPMFDLWSDVFAAPGTRTTGGGAQTYALTGPGWSGTLPAGVTRIAAPTAVGWMAGRIQIHGSADYDAGHAFQDGLKAAPLSRWGKDATAPRDAPRGVFDATRDMQPPAAQILRLTAAQYFGLFTTLTTANPPHANDYPMLHRIGRLGLAPGMPFDQEPLAADVRAVLQQTPRSAGQALFEAFKRAGTRTNGWRSLVTPMGAYGSDYRRRQVVAYTAFGADLSEDVYYLTTTNDAEQRPLESANRYTLHLDAATLPPVRAFWSLTAYNEENHLAPGKRARVTIGSRDALANNADGSLDLYVQATTPGPDKEANWLPIPGDGGRFSLMLRLYWPEVSALDGPWIPPSVVRVPDGRPSPGRPPA
jgi:hypothetical protein